MGLLNGAGNGAGTGIHETDNLVLATGRHLISVDVPNDIVRQITHFTVAGDLLTLLNVPNLD